MPAEPSRPGFPRPQQLAFHAGFADLTAPAIDLHAEAWILSALLAAGGSGAAWADRPQPVLAEARALPDALRRQKKIARFSARLIPHHRAGFPGSHLAFARTRTGRRWSRLRVGRTPARQALVCFRSDWKASSSLTVTSTVVKPGFRPPQTRAYRLGSSMARWKKASHGLPASAAVFHGCGDKNGAEAGDWCASSGAGCRQDALGASCGC